MEGCCDHPTKEKGCQKSFWPGFVMLLCMIAMSFQLYSIKSQLDDLQYDVSRIKIDVIVMQGQLFQQNASVIYRE